MELAERKNNSKAKGEKTVAGNMPQFVVEEGKKVAKKDFGKFSAIVAVIFSIVLWGIKSMWYAYMSGKFSVYKIDTCYINADNENVFLQIIQLAAIVIIWFTINYIYYKISVAEDKSKFSWKKRGKLLSFWVVEMFMSFAWFLFYSHTEISDLVCEITVGEVFALLIAFFIFCVMINIFAIEFLAEERRRKKRAKKANGQENDSKIKKELRVKDIFWPVITTVAVELIIVFFLARYVENEKCNYKLIITQSEADIESEFLIDYGMSKNKCEMYPVVYENESCYIVTRLYNDNGKIRIDYNYQRIVEKEGQETIYVQNIYNIGLDN